MNASELLQRVIENQKMFGQFVQLTKELPPDEAVQLVPQIVTAFNEHKLWPQDAASFIAACHPTDDQLLDLLQSGHERTQKLGLHIIAKLIENDQFERRSHTVLAQVILKVLTSEAFRQKRKNLKPLKDWAVANTAELSDDNRCS